MQKNPTETTLKRRLFMNIVIVVVFAAVMLSSIIYMNDNKPNLKLATLTEFAENFKEGVDNAHANWLGEDRPQIVLLVTYANDLRGGKELIATERKPVFMSSIGWPKAEPTSKGCEQIWDMVLNIPMDIDGFRVIAEFYDGVKLNNDPLGSVCRYRLSTGAYFEYKVAMGEVSSVTS